MRARSADAGGFTLVEVLIALVVLGGIVLLMAPTGARFPSVIVRSQRAIQAAAAADAQIALVRVYPLYDSLVVRFDSTKNNMPFPGWTLTTDVVRTGAGTTADITRASVTITGPGLAAPIKRVATVAAP